MIASIVKTKLLALLRDRVAVMLTCLLPIVFYAIFAGIFGGIARSGGVSSMVAVLVDDDGTDTSRRIAEALEHAGSGLTVRLADASAGEPRPWTLESARQAVRKGHADAAIIIPRGMGISFGPTDAVPVRVLVDPSNPIAGTAIPGLLQQAAITGMQSTMIRSGMEQLERFGGGLTPQQQRAIDLITAEIANSEDHGDHSDDTSIASAMLLPVQVEDVAATTDEPPRSMATYYLAAIGVMFLLFSVAGASGSLLEDQEAGILDRLLFTPLGMTRLLLANGMWMTIMAFGSMLILFVFATIAFGVGPWTWPRVLACVIITAVTATTASGLGLLLATACRSRAQLAGVSTVVILAMSALGGSMIPRFAMPAAVQEVGWYTTFNAWAVEGYLEVFWYTSPTATTGSLLVGIAPAAGVLLCMTVAFFIAARLLARRWKAV